MNINLIQSIFNTLQFLEYVFNICNDNDFLYCFTFAMCHPESSAVRWEAIYIGWMNGGTDRQTDRPIKLNRMHF